MQTAASTHSTPPPPREPSLPRPATPCMRGSWPACSTGAVRRVAAARRRALSCARFPCPSPHAGTRLPSMGTTRAGRSRKTTSSPMCAPRGREARDVMILCWLHACTRRACPACALQLSTTAYLLQADFPHAYWTGGLVCGALGSFWPSSPAPAAANRPHPAPLPPPPPPPPTLQATSAAGQRPRASSAAPPPTCRRRASWKHSWGCRPRTATLVSARRCTACQMCERL